MATAGSKTVRSNSHEELIAAGIQAIFERGVDQVTVSHVTSISGHSRPTFYSYFGDIHGMFAELWIQFGIAWLDSLLEFEDEPKDAYAQQIDHAMLQIFALTHRTPEVAEVVITDVKKWWAEKFKGNQYTELRAAWIMSVRLGVYIAEKITPGIALSEKVLPALRAIPDNLDGHPMLKGLGPLEEIPQAAPMIRSDSSVESELLEATASVVASSGVAAASVARIARKCRVSTGTVYPRFATGFDLLEATFDAAIKDIVRGNLDHLKTYGLTLDRYGLIISGGLGENRRVWRDYRLEMYLAAMYDERMVKMMGPGFEETRNILVSESITQEAVSPEFVDPLSWLMQALAVGLGLLFNAGAPVQRLDHRIVIRFLAAAVVQNA